MDKISQALQQNLVTLLVHSNEYGKLIAQRVPLEYFENEYRTIAEVATRYWKKYKEAPGEAHIGDDLASILEDRENKRRPTIQRMLVSMIELYPVLNVNYTMNSINEFIETQEIKSALMNSYEKVNQGGELTNQEIKDIWTDIIRVKHDNFHMGMQMTEITKLMNFLEYQTTEFLTGIGVFDKAQIVPIRRKVMLFIAPSGKGKTWFLCNVGKKALMSRRKVLFISLEMDEEEIVQRMYQSLFAVSKREATTDCAYFTLNDLKRLDDIKFKKVKAEFTFNSETLKEELEMRLIQHQRIISNFVVKRFEPRSVTVKDIEAYIDNLEMSNDFIPDMIILDYMGRIKTKIEHHRLNLGTELEEFRGLMIRRNTAGVTAMQVNREGSKAGEVGSMHVAEDVSFVNTSDNILTQSMTELEEKLGICRVRNTKARSEVANITALVARNIALGQYCVQSVPFEKERHKELMKDFGDEEDDDVYDREDKEKD